MYGELRRAGRATLNGLGMAFNPRLRIVRGDGSRDPRAWNILPTATVFGGAVGWHLGGPEQGASFAAAVVVAQTTILVGVSSLFELFDAHFFGEEPHRHCEGTAPTSASPKAEVV